MRQQRLSYGLRAVARDWDARAVTLAVSADEEFHLAAVALELFHVRDVHEPAAMRAQERRGFKELNAHEPEVLAFMQKRVVPETARLLGLPEFDFTTHAGFGCYQCQVRNP